MNLYQLIGARVEHMKDSNIRHMIFSQCVGNKEFDVAIDVDKEDNIVDITVEEIKGND